MKLQYVKTSNHDRFMAAIKAVENRGSPEACIMLLTGEPGTGKTCTMDNWGAGKNAVYIEGIPGMNLAYVNDYLADQTGVRGAGKFQQFKMLTEHFAATRQPIILDEAQHGLPDKAATIEHLRRVAEKSGVTLVLACHTSERHRFAGERLAHISTRISCVAELKRASAEDCALYLNQLCEVKVDAKIAGVVHAQSGGRFRLMANACRTLEALAAAKGLKELTADVVGKTRLCEDAMAALAKGGRGHG
jgi:DNA transposition AAA+ family ATPase